MTTQENALRKTQYFWQDFYVKQHNLSQPSPFACWVLAQYLQQPKRIVEIGCGNGRDSFVFAHQQHDVLAFDACDIAIEKNQQQAMTSGLSNKLFFMQYDLDKIEQLPVAQAQWIQSADVFYSRFVFHAFSERIEDKILSFMTLHLPKNALMVHEFRTNKDPLMMKGEVISAHERMTDHYRRFIDTRAFRNKIAALGWKEEYFEESTGLAVFGDEDPVVARCVFKKLESKL